MRAAAAQGEPAALRREAHRLKSSSAFVGAMRLSALCELLEQQAQADVSDQAAACTEAIGVELAAVGAALRAERRKHMA
jgi:HPt (histidine-containing phosphotransfer) domain-containing protein